ncbi:hypothetical protein, partial [Simplicispira psychrophila]|uniref:hypothetical protein n=1 Tax=Simplicispira psychrophila TaxID=80882 RepID=UPI001B80007C
MAGNSATERSSSGRQYFGSGLHDKQVSANGLRQMAAFGKLILPDRYLASVSAGMGFLVCKALSQAAFFTPGGEYLNIIY